MDERTGWMMHCVNLAKSRLANPKLMSGEQISRLEWEAWILDRALVAIQQGREADGLLGVWVAYLQGYADDHVRYWRHGLDEAYREARRLAQEERDAALAALPLGDNQPGKAG